MALEKTSMQMLAYGAIVDVAETFFYSMNMLLPCHH